MRPFTGEELDEMIERIVKAGGWTSVSHGVADHLLDYAQTRLARVDDSSRPLSRMEQRYIRLQHLEMRRMFKGIVQDESANGTLSWETVDEVLSRMWIVAFEIIGEAMKLPASKTTSPPPIMCGACKLEGRWWEWCPICGRGLRWQRWNAECRIGIQWGVGYSRTRMRAAEDSRYLEHMRR